MTRTLAVSEIFGPTFQGEGPSTGRRCWFLRLALCNLACTWCDTPYTWDWKRFDRKKEISPITVEDLLEQLSEIEPPMLVITGGEPLVQRKGLAELLEALPGNPRFELETNGTLPPDELEGLIDQWNVSPKLANAGNTKPTIVPEVLEKFSYMDEAVFKFVCCEEADLDAVALLVAQHGIPPERVWIMPEGVNSGQLLGTARYLAESVLEYGYNLTLRQQALLWEGERCR